MSPSLKKLIPPFFGRVSQTEAKLQRLKKQDGTYENGISGRGHSFLKIISFQLLLSLVFSGAYILNINMYLEPVWPLFWLQEVLFWGGSPSKIEVIWGSRHTYIFSLTPTPPSVRWQTCTRCPTSSSRWGLDRAGFIGLSNRGSGVHSRKSTWGFTLHSTLAILCDLFETVRLEC